MELMVFRVRKASKDLRDLLVRVGLLVHLVTMGALVVMDLMGRGLIQQLLIAADD